MEKTRRLTVSAILKSHLFHCACFFSAALSAVLTLGGSLYRHNSLIPVFGSFSAFGISFLKCTGLFLLFLLILIPVLYFLRNLQIQDKQHRWFLSDGKRSILTGWGVFLLCWIPVWLAYFPGVFSYDADQQVLQAIGKRPFSNHHPFLHTLFVKGCFDLGGLFGGFTAGVVVYSIIQMMILSFVFSFVLWRLAKMRIHWGIRLGILLILALNPVTAVFSFVITKDVLLGGALLLLTVLLAEMLQDKERFFRSKIKCFSLFVVVLFTCLLRNNAFYAMLLFGIVLIICYKTDWRKILTSFGAAVLAALLIVGPLYTGLGVYPGSTAEMLSVPAQQIALAAVHHWDELTDEEKEMIGELLPVDIAYAYNPRFADPIKNKLKISGKFNSFAGLWLKLFARYPGDYTDAALSLNLASWYPGAKHPDEYSKRLYVETQIYKSRGDFAFHIERRSVFPRLFRFYESLVREVKQQHIPIVGFFYSLAAPIWTVFFGIILCFVKRKKRMILLCLPAVLLWLTFLAGPVANLRYVYPLIICCPVYIGIFLQMKTAYKSY